MTKPKTGRMNNSEKIEQVFHNLVMNEFLHNQHGTIPLKNFVANLIGRKYEFSKEVLSILTNQAK